tara:strand:- start:108 stop:278 length:171 start_codon:yes stop_codon:yes gene_type:complete
MAMSEEEQLQRIAISKACEETNHNPDMSEEEHTRRWAIIKEQERNPPPITRDQEDQ